MLFRCLCVCYLYGVHCSTESDDETMVSKPVKS
jgi:hypothetical protein